jgi:hypothetical protein
MAVINKEYLDYTGLQRYDQLIKDYVNRSEGFTPTYDSSTETLIFGDNDSISADLDSTNNQNN